MANTLLGKTKVLSLLDPVAATSDGATGNYVDYNGWNFAIIGCQAGLIGGTGDSDDTVAFQVHRVDDILASAAAATDHVDITAGIATLGPSASTTASLDIELIHLDFTQHTLDNGCLNITATVAETGGSVPVSAFIQLYGRNGSVSDTLSGKTIVVPASS